MNGSLLGGEWLVNGEKAVKRGHTVSCSWSTSSEDGEVGNLMGISLVTASAPGRCRLMGGTSQVEPGMGIVD